MKKILAIALAGVMAVTASLGTTTQANAFWPWWGVGLAIGAIALGTGAAIAYSHDHYAGMAPSAAPTATNDHVTACKARYRSYDEATDTFLGRGGKRYLCRL